MPFISPYNNPKVMLLSDRHILPWITLEQLVYESPLTGETYVIPKHMRTDAASIPKALVLVPVVGPALFQRFFGRGVWQGFREAILHDYLRTKKDGAYPVPSSMAHSIFEEALTEAGYPEDLIENYVAAVRTFNSD